MFFKIFKPLLLMCFLASSVFSLKATLKLKQVVGGSFIAPNPDNATMPAPGELINKTSPQQAQEINATLPTNATLPSTPLIKETAKDVIKIKALYDNPSLSTDEAIKQNDQKVQELITKLKELGLKDENIENLGSSLIPRKKIQNRVFRIKSENETAAKNQTSEDKQLYASSEVDIQLNDTDLAEKVIELLKAQKFRVESVDYKHETKLLQQNYLSASNDQGPPPLICVVILGIHICI